MKVVIDTNVLSVAISRRSKLHPIWQGLRNQVFDLLVTDEILYEYEEVIGKDLSPELASIVLDVLETLPNITFVRISYNWTLITVDPDDNKFVDCTIIGAADYLVTDDRHFNILKDIDYPKVPVVSSERFLEILSA